MTAHLIWPVICKYMLVSTPLTLAPGMDTLITLRMALIGRRTGMGAVLGICVGLAIWGLAAGLGLAALIQSSPWAYGVLKAAGTAYLAWLGGKLLFFPGRTDWVQTKTQKEGQEAPGFWHGFTRGLGTDLLNPVGGIFTMSFFAGFMPAWGRPLDWSILFTVIDVGLSLICLGAVVWFLGPVARVLTRPQVGLWLDRFAGVMFLYFVGQMLWRWTMGA